MKDIEALLLAGGGLLALKVLSGEKVASSGGGSGGGGTSLNLGMPSINLGGWDSNIAQPLKASADRATAEILASSASANTTVDTAISGIVDTVTGTISKGLVGVAKGTVGVSPDIKGALDFIGKSAEKGMAAGTIAGVGLAGKTVVGPAFFPVAGAGMAATAAGNMIMDFFTGGKQVKVPVSKSGQAISGDWLDFGAQAYNYFKAPSAPLKPIGDVAQGFAGFFGTINNAVGKLFG